MDDSGHAELRWTCPDCGYLVIGEGLLDSTLPCWLALVEQHCEFTCPGDAAAGQSASPM